MSGYKSNKNKNQGIMDIGTAFGAIAGAYEMYSSHQKAKAEKELKAKQEERAEFAHNERVRNAQIKRFEDLQTVDYATMESFDPVTRLPDGSFVNMATGYEVTEEEIMSTEGIFGKQLKKNQKMAKNPETGEFGVFTFNNDGSLDFKPHRKTVRGEKKNPKAYAPTPMDFTNLDKETKFLKSNTDKLQASILASNQILNELEHNGKLTLAVVRSKAPRMFGEVGNLNEFEQRIWGGSPEVFNALRRFFKEKFSTRNTLTDDDVAIINDVITRATKPIQSRIDREVNNSIKRMNLKGVPPSYAQEYFGEFMKSNEKQATEDPEGWSMESRQNSTVISPKERLKKLRRLKELRKKAGG